MNSPPESPSLNNRGGLKKAHHPLSCKRGDRGVSWRKKIKFNIFLALPIIYELIGLNKVEAQ